MTPENRMLAIAEELRRSAEELTAARTLRDAALIRPAMTRVYYAAFHAARAVLFAEGLEPRTHSDVQHLLNLHFFREGRLEASWNRVLARLQKFREEADYATVFVVDRDGFEGGDTDWWELPASWVRTADKSATSILVDGLAPATGYSFVVRTVTEPHHSNQNQVISDPSATATATTAP